VARQIAGRHLGNVTSSKVFATPIRRVAGRLLRVEIVWQTGITGGAKPRSGHAASREEFEKLKQVDIKSTSLPPIIPIDDESRAMLDYASSHEGRAKIEKGRQEIRGGRASSDRLADG
jgi:hypothetical protein